MHSGITVLLNNLKVFFARRVRMQWSSHATLHIFDSCKFHSFKFRSSCSCKSDELTAHIFSLSAPKSQTAKLMFQKSDEDDPLIVRDYQRNTSFLLASYKLHDLGRHHSTLPTSVR